jgi:hypothetical protein
VRGEMKKKDEEEGEEEKRGKDNRKYRSCCSSSAHVAILYDEQMNGSFSFRKRLRPNDKQRVVFLLIPALLSQYEKGKFLLINRAFERKTSACVD